MQGRYYPAVLVLAVTLLGPGRAAAGDTPIHRGTNPGDVIVEVRKDRFEWTSAGIGAAAGFALASIAGGVVLSTRTSTKRR